MQGAFLFAALAGFLTALLGIIPQASWLGFAGPLLTIVGFYWWGHHAGLDERGDTRQRFADSCYFLGFLLTMCAMLIGFFPSGMLGHELTSQGILRHFSMALGATALGLVFRILALQGGRSIDEDVAEVEAELHEYARKVTKEARAISAELETSRIALGANASTLIDLVGSEAPSAFSQMLDTMRGSAQTISHELANQAAELRRTAAAVAEGLQVQALELADVESRSADAQRRLDDSLGATVVAVTDLRSSLTDLQTQLTAAVGEATRAISAVSASFDTAARRLPGLEQGVATLDERIDAAGRTLSTIHSDIGAAAVGAVEAADRARTLSDTLDEGQRNALAAFATAADRFSDRAAAAAGEAIAGIHQQVAAQVDEQLRAGAEGFKPVQERADSFERSIADATGRLVAVVDRFSEDLAELRREAESL